MFTVNQYYSGDCMQWEIGSNNIRLIKASVDIPWFAHNHLVLSYTLTSLITLKHDYLYVKINSERTTSHESEVSKLISQVVQKSVGGVRCIAF